MFKRDRKSSGGFDFIKLIGVVILIAVIVSAASAVVMFLWNAILPDVTGVKPLTFWKAMGLLVLAKILFGGIGKIFGGKRYSRRKHWRNKWMKMSPEERREAKMRWKEHCRKRKNTDSEE